MPVIRHYWVPRWGFGAQLRHRESWKNVIVKDFEHQGFYVLTHYAVIPVYLVWVVDDEREAYVSEDELMSR